MSLKDVTNRGYVPPTESLMIVQDEPPPAPRPEPVQTALPLWRTLRTMREGEVGNVDSPKYPDVPYSVDTLRNLINRLAKGCDYMLDHLTDAQGQTQIGFFCDLLETTQCMAIAHMANHVLNES